MSGANVAIALETTNRAVSLFLFPLHGSCDFSAHIW